MSLDICKFYVIENNIYAYVSVIKGRENRIRFNTGVKIDKSFWDVKRGTAKRQYARYNEINIELNNIKSKVNTIYKELIDKHADLTEIPISNLKIEFFELYDDMKVKIEKTKFWHSFDKYLETKRNEIQHVTIQKILVLKNHLTAYEATIKKELTFESIDLLFKDSFYEFLLSKNMTDNSISKMFVMLRGFLNWSFDRNFHGNLQYKRREFSITTIQTDIITLTFSELETLYHFNFSSEKHSKVRDLFVFQCFVGLRVSDLKRLKRSDFTNEALKFRVQKTSELILIPLHEYAKEIMTRYNGNENPLPVISEQRYNEYIKEICKIVGIDKETTVTTKRGGRKQENVYPKYELVTSHTARRTFITLQLEKGIRPDVVMKMSGHKSYSSFKKYIDITPNQIMKEYNEAWKVENNLKLVEGGV